MQDLQKYMGGQKNNSLKHAGNTAFFTTSGLDEANQRRRKYESKKRESI
jgi:hypothetical protein